MAATVVVSGEWLDACGYGPGVGNDDTAMDVVEVFYTSSRDQFFGTMYKVRRPDGVLWTVCQGRVKGRCPG